MKELKARMPELKQAAQTREAYKKTYRGIFELYTSQEQKTLDLETAEQLWEVYLRPRLKTYNRFTEFLAQLPDRETFRVHRDLWNMLLDFAVEIGDVAMQYSEVDGWPVFIDNYAGWLKAHP